VTKQYEKLTQQSNMNFFKSIIFYCFCLCAQCSYMLSMSCGLKLCIYMTMNECVLLCILSMSWLNYVHYFPTVSLSSKRYIRKTVAPARNNLYHQPNLNHKNYKWGQQFLKKNITEREEKNNPWKWNHTILGLHCC